MGDRQDMRADKNAYESKELEDKIGEHLSKFIGDGDASPAPEPEDNHDLETDDTSTPDEDEGQADDDSLSQDDDGGEDDNSTDDSEPEADEKPAIPDNVYRSLMHAEYTPEEISEFYESNPKAALKLFNKVHKDVNNMSKQFAELGRTRIELERQEQTTQESETTKQTPNPVAEALKAAKEDDPDNPLIPVLQAIGENLRTNVGQPAQPAKQQVNTQDDLTLATQIMGFLGSDDMKDYKDFYGPARDANNMPTFGGQDCTMQQLTNRQELVNKADEIWVGAKMHGRELAVGEALELAHMILTEPIREKKVRESLVKNVKKRSKGMTIRPAESKTLKASDEEGKPLTEEELEAKTEARLKKLRLKAGG